MNKIDPYLRLMRLDRPIGTLLLLWPTLIALLFAFDGIPNSRTTFIFIAGVFLTRAAGCVVNDFADRQFDRNVKRTINRPLAAKEITSFSAFALFFILLLASACLLFFLNIYCFIVAIIDVMMMVIYPLLKRYTYLPQVWLGLVFNGVPLAYAAAEKFNVTAILLFISTLLFTVAYDTYYAMTDKEDDLKIGIKSTAILFGRFDKVINISLQIFAIVLMLVIGILSQRNEWFYIGLTLAAACSFYQYYLASTLKTENYFRAFQNSNWLLLFIFFGTYLSFLP